MTKNFKISFDPENAEHIKMLKYIANQDNICGFLWELQHNFPRSIRKSQVELTGEEVLEKLRELMDDENLIDIDEMEKTSLENESKPSWLAAVGHCPDLTNLWFQTNGKKQQGAITEDEANQIYDALTTLEKYELCQLKFGI